MKSKIHIVFLLAVLHVSCLCWIDDVIFCLFAFHSLLYVIHCYRENISYLDLKLILSFSPIDDGAG